MWKNRLFWVSSRSTSSSCGTTSTTMLPNWSKNKIVSSLINGKIEWDAVTEEMDATYLTDSYLRQISYCPSLPIRLSWKQSTRLYTTRLLSCTDLREPESPRQSRTLSPMHFIKGSAYCLLPKRWQPSVVQNRLAAIGLAPVLSGNSPNKTKKSTVISQLKATSEIIRQTAPEEFRKEAERLLLLRTELNKYIEALHKEYPFRTFAV